MKNASSLTILLVYIDDVILSGSDLNEFNSTKLALDNTFKIKHFGSLNYFLSIEVAQSKERIFLNQRTYCPDLLEDSGFIKSKPVTTSFDPTIKLHQDSRKLYHDIPSYKKTCRKIVVPQCNKT